MKKLIPLLLIAALLCGCGSTAAEETTAATDPSETIGTVSYPDVVDYVHEETAYVSRFGTETHIVLSDTGITVNGGEETQTVYTSHDIIYYEDKDAYDSGYPYGEGTDADKHTAREAEAHTVVNITAPGAYRVTGTLSAGQIRIDLGDAAYYDENAVVELILEDADITCTVAPAILFLNVYECDGEWSTETAVSEVDTTAAGANLILEGSNTVSGSYVARIYKDKEGEKKLWKQDGALYSYMSMNVYGPGSLDLTAENEGLDSELHLTIWGGDINIRADNDGINTNEDGVSVTTINGGSLHIIAGLGEEGDGIDSNGYLVINGGVVVASANPAADAGLDSDMGSYVNGGIVVALGSTMDWAESDSRQVTMNLQFADFQSSGSSIVIAYPDGTVAFAYDPGQDEVLGENVRRYQGAIISCPNLQVGQSYAVYLGSAITGTETGGVYQVTTVTAFENGTRMMYTGTDVGMGGMMPGGDMGGFGGGIPEGMGSGQQPQMPGNVESPEDFTRPEGDYQIPETPSMPDFETSGQAPDGFEPGNMEGDLTMPADMEFPEDFDPGTMQGMGGRGQMGGMTDGEAAGNIAMENTLFYISDMVNAFSGVTAAN